MGVKVKELPQASLAAKPCDPVKGGCCSTHRRADRVYEDQVWQFMRETGEYPWRGELDNRGNESWRGTHGFPESAQ